MPAKERQILTKGQAVLKNSQIQSGDIYFSILIAEKVTFILGHIHD
jgi:hypothetical protein